MRLDPGGPGRSLASVFPAECSDPAATCRPGDRLEGGSPVVAARRRLSPMGTDPPRGPVMPRCRAFAATLRPVAMDVDVMVPAYGDGPLVREAINSVLAQDDKHWRLTVIDDAAAIEHGELEQWLAGLGDSRVRYLANPQRLGINRNFQRCADESTAEWVVILGADDRLLPL